jgi:hypothetical protein
LPFLVLGREDLINCTFSTASATRRIIWRSIKRFRSNSSWQGLRPKLSAFTRPDIAASSRRRQQYSHPFPDPDNSKSAHIQKLAIGGGNMLSLPTV